MAWFPRLRCSRLRHPWLRHPWLRHPWLRHRSLGQQGERIAARYLRRRGFRIVDRQKRGRLGEIDLVAVQRHTVVFVEVKTRRSHDHGHPAEAVDGEKQRRLTRLALAYLRSNDLLEAPARFDVVCVTWPEDARRPTIEHLPNAFQPLGTGSMFS